MTTREDFLTALRAKSMPLVKVDDIEGLPPFYMRGATIAILRAQLQSPRGDSTLDQMRTDPLYMERALAKMILGEDGKPLFDSKDDEQMQQFRLVLDEVSPDINNKIQTRQLELNEGPKPQLNPGPLAEVDAAGN